MNISHGPASSHNLPVCRSQEVDATSECSTVVCNQDVLLEKDDVFSEHSNEPASEALVLFDWDDTLFPTTWLHQNGLLEDGELLDHEQQTQLEHLAETVRETLEIAAQSGKVVVVTNAQEGWIEKSCTAFMPSLKSLLKEIDIVSARSTYEAEIQDPSEWKRLAFLHEVDLLYGSDCTDQQRNVVSVGDSMHELNALKAVTCGQCNCSGKSVKLLESPSVEQLVEQHEVLKVSLLDIVRHEGDLDIEIGNDSAE